MGERVNPIRSPVNGPEAGTKGGPVTSFYRKTFHLESRNGAKKIEGDFLEGLSLYP